MRLTPDLINSSLSYLNPLKERELDLRGHKIPTIENLAVAHPHDSLDLTDNALTQLSNFPLSPRLRTLLCARNRITHLSPTLSTTLPNLTVLILTANNLSSLADLLPLGDLPRLTHLTLIDNPITRRDNYRLWLLHLCPSLRFLDYARVKEAERLQASDLFGTRDAPTARADKIRGLQPSRTGTFEVGAGITTDDPDSQATRGATDLRIKLTPEERSHVEAMIRNAKSLSEIAKLEKDLREGKVPALVTAKADVEMSGS